jgi:hypothetical protein
MDQQSPKPVIALIWRGDPGDPSSPKTERFDPVIAALHRLGATTRVVPFSDARLGEVRAALTGVDGMLVWVDPVDPRGDRSNLDPLLRNMAAQDIWIGAHPDVIARMGAKSVLFTTKALGWGVDTKMHRSAMALEASLRQTLVGGPRVIKRNRGNGGQGVWKVEMAGDGQVAALEAVRGSAPQALELGQFCRTWAGEFESFGFVIDQPFQPRLADGMVRCYVSGEQVVGFGVQKITALLWPPAEPGPRIMRLPEDSELQGLRRAMEDDWIPGLRRRLRIQRSELPALWDADFLYGPKTAAGEDSFVLCEINASSVAPFPVTAIMPLAKRAMEATLDAQRGRKVRPLTC